MVRHIISSIWNFQVSSAFTAFTETTVSLSCIIICHNPLVVLTLKTVPSKMSSTITGKADSFKGKASVLWFEGLCGVSAPRPRSGVSLSLTSDGLQCTVQDGCYAI